MAFYQHGTCGEYRLQRRLLTDEYDAAISTRSADEFPTPESSNFLAFLFGGNSTCQYGIDKQSPTLENGSQPKTGGVCALPKATAARMASMP